MERQLAEPQRLAMAVLPEFDWDDTKKRTFISYRLTGFNTVESCEYTGIALRTVYRWRKEDALLEHIESNINELRRQFSKEFVQMETMRNLRLVLAKDYEVLRKAAHPKIDPATNLPEQLTQEEYKYLLRIRQFYSPQNLQDITGLLNSQLGSYDEVVLALRRSANDKAQPPYSIPALSQQEEHKEGTDNQKQYQGDQAEEEIGDTGSTI